MVLNLLLPVDLQFFAAEKTEKATPRRREEEREKGRVAKSQDVNTAILLLFTFIMLAVYGRSMKEQLATLYEYTFTEYIHWEVTIETIPLLVTEIISEVAKVILPVMGVAFIAAIAANLLQVGFLFTTEPLVFDLKKIDPIQGAKRIFSVRAFIELLKSFFKILFIGIVTFAVIWLYKDDMMMLALKNAEQAITFFGQITMTMGIAAIIALLVLAVLDYVYQRYDYEKNIRMSKQEIKDEHKDIEGDPLIRSRMREKQRQIAMQRMMSEVPEADVIITNPTHYAIAIRYDEEKAEAPFVVAKGMGHIAQRIIDIAEAHDIISVENKTLARALYNEVEIGEVIPEKFYQAVAEVLAYVYRLERRM